MRDKTIDERFFILTLFAIAMELEQKTKSLSKTIFEVELRIGLPPKHYGSLYKKFEAYFKREKIIHFIYHEKEYNIYMNKVFAFLQDYAAAMTIYTVFVGGDSLLLQPFLCTSNKIGTHFFIEDIRANAKGYNILYEIQKKAGIYHGQKK